jgi:alpha-N-arabinofuranosidase
MRANTGAIIALALAASGFGQEITHSPEQAGRVKLRINAAQKAAYQIPNTIFGSFLEPIGNSTYNGLWAEILQNPSFENGLWDSAHIDAMVAEIPELARATNLGLPLPWEPLDATEGNRYEPRRGDAANSWQSLAIFGVPGRQTGVKQMVFVPAYRELRYTGTLFAKHLEGATHLDVSLRKRTEPVQVFAHVSIDASATGWRKYPFELTLTQGQINALEPADFAITVEGDERVLIDQVTLFPADAVDGLDRDMVAFAKEMHTPLVRFGGNYTSAYHWRDGIGPRDKRISMRNIAWGIPEYNEFGTDEFLRFCDLIGARPQIALNLGSGTPEEAAGWVRYVDEHWPTHHGLLWELGNELWGNWNLGYPTLDQLPHRTEAFSRAVRAVDPSATLIATGQDPDHFEQWNAAELSDPAGTFNFLSTHFVVTTDRIQDKNPTPDAVAEATFALPEELGRKLRAMQAQINQSVNFRDRVHIAFTEWLFVCCGAKPDTAPRWDNMGGAVAAGAFFNMLMRNADIVPISDMTGIIEFAGIWKKRGRVFATPAYYTFRMFSTAEPETAVAVANDSPTYSVRQGVTRLPDIADVPYLDVVAAMDRSGDRLTLFCVNRHLTRDIPADIQIDGIQGAESADIQQISASSIYEVNSEANPENIRPVTSHENLQGPALQHTFPHESVTRIDVAIAR